MGKEDIILGFAFKVFQKILACVIVDQVRTTLTTVGRQARPQKKQKANVFFYVSP